VGPRAGMDGRKISSPPGFDSGPSSPKSVAIPTELPAHVKSKYTVLLTVDTEPVRECLLLKEKCYYCHQNSPCCTLFYNTLIQFNHL